MVQTILGLRADAPNKRLYVNPTLPAWFSEVVLRNLRVGPCLFTLHFWREGDRSRWEVVNMAVDSGVAQEDVIQVMEELAVTSSRSSRSSNGIFKWGRNELHPHLNMPLGASLIRLCSNRSSQHKGRKSGVILLYGYVATSNETFTWLVSLYLSFVCQHVRSL
jgi:hypothetical protein